MKKLFLNNKYLYFTLALSLFLSSCLKDEGFDNGEYGTVNKNTEGQKWISIPLAANAVNTVGVESKPGFQPINLFPVSFDFKDPAAADITATVRLNNALITDPNVVILPTSAYTLTTNTLTVKAGQRISDPLVLGLNTDALDPTKKYGIAFTLESVSPSDISIPTNLRNAVFVFTIKNKFDGIYTLRFRMEPGSDRAASWAGPYTYAYDQHLVTTGPNTVKLFNTAFGAGFHPLMTPGASGFGSTEPEFEFDADNKLIGVRNLIVGARTFRLNPAVTDSRYDPATKTVYAAIIMDQTGFEPLPIFDTFRYVRPRP
jgi:hypothetical protein